LSVWEESDSRLVKRGNPFKEEEALNAQMIVGADEKYESVILTEMGILTSQPGKVVGL
jgi:hypothetical protein